jgi:hypothetical protein
LPVIPTKAGIHSWHKTSVDDDPGDGVCLLFFRYGEGAELHDDLEVAHLGGLATVRVVHAALTVGHEVSGDEVVHGVQVAADEEVIEPALDEGYVLG